MSVSWAAGTAEPAAAPAAGPAALAAGPAALAAEAGLAAEAAAPAPPPAITGTSTGTAADAVAAHLDAVLPAFDSLRSQAGRLTAWGEELARRLLAGHRLLVAGNGGSAAEAQHLTAELVGRFDGERIPFSAISLHAESSATSAIANDYGFEEVYARQVRAHGRAGDVLLLLSTSGRSRNLLRAAEAAAGVGMLTWALTGRAPNPLASMCRECLTLDAVPASAQECHLIAIHALCRAFDAEIARLSPGSVGEGQTCK